MYVPFADHVTVYNHVMIEIADNQDNDHVDIVMSDQIYFVEANTPPVLSVVHK
jgi:hypothetical protein